MCAILDNSTRDEVFGNAPTERGRFFFEWINHGQNRLAIGGTKLRAELGGSTQQPGSVNFRRWLPTAIRRGLVIQPDDDDTVDTVADNLEARGICLSDDPHVLALAQETGARLLYSNDGDLQDDFRNREIIGGVRGKIYPNTGYREFLNDRRNRRLCSR